MTVKSARHIPDPAHPPPWTTTDFLAALDQVINFKEDMARSAPPSTHHEKHDGKDNRPNARQGHGTGHNTNARQGNWNHNHQNFHAKDNDVPYNNYALAAANPSQHNDDPKTKPRVGLGTKVVKPPSPCFLCNDKKDIHWSQDCKRYTNWKARCIKADNLKVCIFYLSKRHDKSRCPKRKQCYYCKGTHHQIFCPQKFPIRAAIKSALDDHVNDLSGTELRYHHMLMMPLPESENDEYEVPEFDQYNEMPPEYVSTARQSQAHATKARVCNNQRTESRWSELEEDDGELQPWPGTEHLPPIETAVKSSNLPSIGRPLNSKRLSKEFCHPLTETTRQIIADELSSESPTEPPTVNKPVGLDTKKETEKLLQMLSVSKASHRYGHPKVPEPATQDKVVIPSGNTSRSLNLLISLPVQASNSSTKQQAMAFVDTGAQRNFVSKAFAAKAGLKPLRHELVSVVGISCEKLEFTAPI
jgi:hypothetical protein